MDSALGQRWEVMTATLAEERLDLLNTLPVERQQQVLEYARDLAQPRPAPRSPLPPGKPKEAFLAFHSDLPAEAVDEMERAIEQGCERIEPDAQDELVRLVWLQVGERFTSPFG
jgi:hypothetical protein